MGAVSWIFGLFGDYKVKCDKEGHCGLSWRTRALLWMASGRKTRRARSAGLTNERRVLVIEPSSLGIAISCAGHMFWDNLTNGQDCLN